MAQLDWRALTPDHPVTTGEGTYVSRRVGGDRLAALVRNGLAPLLVCGPDGCGKTTEVLRAAEVLTGDLRAVRVELRDLCPLEEVTERRVLFGVAERLLDHTVDHQEQFQPSEALVADLRASDPVFPRGHGLRRLPLDLVQAVAEEITRQLEGTRLVLLVDGLDEVPVEQGRTVALALYRVRDLLDVVLVTSPALVNGPQNHAVVTRYRVFSVPVLPVADADGLDGEPGRRFLAEIARKRLGIDEVPAELEEALGRVALMSGGVPRTFLRLLHDAGLYAFLAEREVPDEEDIAEAVRDHADSLRRVLQAGDLDALAAAAATSGLDVPADRRVRFLSHALLVEYVRGGEVVVFPHPLIQRLLGAS